MFGYTIELHPMRSQSHAHDTCVALFNSHATDNIIGGVKNKAQINYLVRVGIFDAVNVIVGVSVRVFDGVNDSVGINVSDAVKVGFDVFVGVRDTNALKLLVPKVTIRPSANPSTELRLSTAMTITSFTPAGTSITP